jgi:hypothetical protein
MNYCSIQDAWGNSIANSYTNYMKDKNQPHDVTPLPIPSDISQEIYSNTNLLNNDNEKINNSVCNNYLTHIQHCKSCQLEIEKYNNNKYSIINYLFKFTEDNKDFVILGFILLFVLLFINLINNLNKF